MQPRNFGNSGRAVAPIGQGSWQIETAREADAIASLQRGLDLGLTHIDTAEMYGSGAAERLVGKAIRGRREQVFLVSKVLPTNASQRGTIEACERSLRNLDTDHLDCYLLHWRGQQPLAGTIAAFESLRSAGKIGCWGVSNFDVADLEETLALGGTPACNQVLYHIRERAIEHAVIPWCAARGIAVVAYTPLGPGKALYDDHAEIGQALRQVAAAHRATARQVALRFLLRIPNVFVIPKAATLEHVAENAGAMQLELSPGELAALDAAYGRGAPRRELPMI